MPKMITLDMNTPSVQVSVFRKHSILTESHVKVFIGLTSVCHGITNDMRQAG